MWCISFSKNICKTWRNIKRCIFFIYLGYTSNQQCGWLANGSQAMNTKSKLILRLILRNSNGARIIHAWFPHKCIKFLHWTAWAFHHSPPTSQNVSCRDGTSKARSASTRQAPYKLQPSLAHTLYSRILFCHSFNIKWILLKIVNLSAKYS